MLVSSIKSTKTTVIAFLIAGSALLTAVVAMIDEDPTTVANWNHVIELLLIAFGLLFARDSNVTSERAGAK